jgi:hypothetical protein
MPEPTPAPHDGDRSHADGALDRVCAWLRATGPAEHDPFCETAVVREGLNAGDPKLYRADVRALSEQLAAATARAEMLADDVERLHARINPIRVQRDELRRRLDGLGEPTVEWGYDWCGDILPLAEHERAAMDPTENILYQRNIHTGPWCPVPDGQEAAAG